MRRSISHRLVTAGTCALVVSTPLHGQSLGGSLSSVARQYSVAVAHDFTFLERSRDVRRFVSLGLLVPVHENRYLELAGVSFPYSRPAVKTFVERLSSQYHAACGEKLVVTSLTRPSVRQPGNASEHSVHPAGMAVDLRYPRNKKCRAWLEKTLISLERSRVLDATRERMPAHYHVAIFPTRYTEYVNRLTGRAAQTASARPRSSSASGGTHGTMYRVNRGDTLWSIARKLGTSVDALKAANGLATAQIRAGQRLVVPSGS